jgi:monothiol glutaredoxin
MNEEQAHKFIDEQIKNNDIVLFMKGTPDFPMCGFSGRVVQILQHFNQKFAGINILEDEVLRQAVKTYSKWPTIPQLYVKGEFVGGCDITTEMAQSGELEKLFKDKLS